MKCYDDLEINNATPRTNQNAHPILTFNGKLPVQILPSSSIAGIAKKLQKERHKIMIESNTTLRNIYNNLEKPGKNIIREIHEELDIAVAEAY